MEDKRYKDYDEKGQKPKDHDKPLTREQRRYKERIESEAKAQLDRLTENYYEFFMDNDPESEEVAKKHKECNAKWKMYCHARNLMPSALDAFERQATVLHDKYKKELAG